MNIILASGSPRRREILTLVGARFTVRPATGEEKIEDTAPEAVVKALSMQKAREVAATVDTDAVVIGADTIVAFRGEILGKPKSESDAVRMLHLLSGNEHQVFTGVTALLLREGKTEELSFVEETAVRIAKLSDEEIISYVKTGEPMDKAGAYAVQGLFAKYVEGLNGDFYNVMGLPVARLYLELKQKGIVLGG